MPNYANFLQFQFVRPKDSLLYSGEYDTLWVIVSVLIAIMASYAAISAATRVYNRQDKIAKLIWKLIGVSTLGLGIWGMHFIGMLALRLPCGSYYDPTLTVLSVIPGLLASSIALKVIFTHSKPPSLLLNSVLLGAGVATLHYTGMAAMRLDGWVRYNPYLFALSLLLAVLFSYLLLTVQCKITRPKIQNAVLMGIAFSGMHYTGMAAAYFVRGNVTVLPPTLLTSHTLAIVISLTTLFLALSSLALASISRSREIADKLRESERHFRTLIESIPDAIFLKDGDSRWLITNELAKELFKLHEIPWEGKTEMEIAELHSEYRSAHNACLMDDEKAWDAGKLTLFSERIPSENNGLRDYEVRKMPVFNEQNQRQALVIIGRDITEHKRAEEKLQLSASVFTHASEAIMITTANATILDVNQAFTIITGYSRDDVLGKNPRILSAKKQNKDFYTAMWRELIEKGFHNSEIWNKRKNGEIYLQMLTISAVRDENGVILQYVSLFSDITQRRRAEEEIRNLAFYDRLTKLANRRLLMDKLRQALTASTRTNQYGAILFLDLDHFKILNDTLGHDYGDMMLIEVSHRIKGCLNEMDTVARLGGDEFAILLENIDEHEAIAVHKAALIAEKIRASLSISYQLKEYKQHGSPSIGMCMYRGDKDTADNLLKRADMAMYQVKGSGRNAVRLFDPAMQHALETRIKLEGELHHAIASNQLQLFYQIQVDSELRPTGAEALLRWMHPVHGIISPAEFISIAEESTLILDIGDWVLSCVCQQLALWFSAEKTRHLSLAVNVSARQFNRPDFVARLLTLLHTHKMDVTRLKIELTESVILNDVSDVIARMHTLREIGVVLSMDDFGTGYSSLSYLKQLPLDQIKIDQSFVRDMTCDPNDAVMVETIIDLAKKFRLNVIAEGVETHAQLAYIKQLGCMAYQGYLFSRPVPIEQFEALLQE